MIFEELMKSLREFQGQVEFRRHSDKKNKGLFTKIVKLQSFENWNINFVWSIESIYSETGDFASKNKKIVIHRPPAS